MYCQRFVCLGIKSRLPVLVGVRHVRPPVFIVCGLIRSIEPFFEPSEGS